MSRSTADAFYCGASWYVTHNLPMAQTGTVPTITSRHVMLENITAPYITLREGRGLVGMAWHGMAWRGMARHGMARHGTARGGMARSVTVPPEVERDVS